MLSVDIYMYMTEIHHVVCVQNKCGICKCFTHWGGNRKKSIRNRKNFQKRSVTEKRVITRTFYIMKWKWQACSTHDYM